MITKRNEIQPNISPDLLGAVMTFSSIQKGVVCYRGFYNDLDVVVFCHENEMSEYWFQVQETIELLLESDYVTVTVDGETIIRIN